MKTIVGDSSINADGGLGQHQRRLHHDRRAMRGSDARSEIRGRQALPGTPLDRTAFDGLIVSNFIWSPTRPGSQPSHDCEPLAQSRCARLAVGSISM
jgi:hypothetical protein